MGNILALAIKGEKMIVEVVPYRLEWRKDFEIEKEVLIKYFGGHISEIHHIGSTSVIGLAAKPIIDIILEVPSLIKLDSELNVFQVLGYEAMGEFGIRGRRYYRKGGDNRTHQIHAFEVGDANIDRHIAFRDYLAAHPAVRLEYQDLKIQLAKECENDIDQYCTGKDSFVKHHEAKALQWFAKV